jgi:hypothetical protein
MGQAATLKADVLGHAQRERLRFIEASLLWEGSIRRQQVSQVFNVSLNHVTKDLRRYEEAFPNNILFDHRRQLYVPGPRFKPHLASRDPREYLALQLARAESGSNVVAPLLAGWDTVPICTVPSPPHAITESVLRAVVRAITEGMAIDVRYHSSTGLAPTQRRLWPHALMHTGARWNVRAWDRERKGFFDFVLQRMEQPRSVNKARPVDATEDFDWVHSIKLRVVPHPDLNEHQRALVIRDFGMPADGKAPVWEVELRRCLVRYFARQYGLDRPTAGGQRIVLENLEEVRSLLFEQREPAR